MSNGSNKLAWLVAGLAISGAFNLLFGGALLQSSRDRVAIEANAKAIYENTKSIAALSTQVAVLTSEVRAALKRDES